VSCVICEKRKEKRFCPAVHGRICPQCCGENREITLDCPSDCVYLQQARERELPRPFEQLDKDVLFLNVEVPERFLYEHEHLIVGLSFALAKSARADRNLRDPELISALTAITKAYETLVNSGLYFDAPVTGLTQQAVADEVQKMIKEYREAEQTHVGHVRLRDSDILHALVFLTRTANGRTSGKPKCRAFIDFLLSQFPEKEAALTAAGEPSRIITP
jgi:hypothetical protein